MHFSALPISTSKPFLLNNNGMTNKDRYSYTSVYKNKQHQPKMIRHLQNLLLLLFLMPVTAEEVPQPCTECTAVNETEASTKATEPEPLTNTVLDYRIQQEAVSLDSSFSLIAHRPSYFLLFSYIDDPNETPFDPISQSPLQDQQLENLEVKFQISFRVPVNRNFFFRGSHLWFAYTQLSLWQLYNKDISSPFRETNYEPELLWTFPLNRTFGEVKLTHLVAAVNHQSNGRSDPLSRSWNRVYIDSIWAYKDWVFSFKPWYRLPEGTDDNPDIEDYMGHFEFRTGYKQEDHQFSSLFRAGRDGDKLRAFYELGYSFEINRRFRGYVQIVHGYGETLLDYNHRNKRISLGIMLNDWF